MIGAVTKKLIVFGLKIQFFKKTDSHKGQAIEEEFPLKGTISFSRKQFGHLVNSLIKKQEIKII